MMSFKREGGQWQRVQSLLNELQRSHFSLREGRAVAAVAPLLDEMRKRDVSLDAVSFNAATSAYEKE
eukprot:12401278-Karenia_brevis.AAC.1